MRPNSPRNGAGCGTRTAGTVKERKPAEESKPAKKPADWTLAEIAGTYAWGCKKDQWSETTLRADGTFKRVLHAETGDVVRPRSACPSRAECARS